jgi:hypothetical protein
MTKKISQREARRTRRALAARQAQDAANARLWSSEYVGGTWIAKMIGVPAEVIVAVTVARRLRRGVVVTTDSDGDLHFHAVDGAR